MRLLPMLSVWATLFLMQGAAYGKYIHFYHNDAGEPVAAIYQGDADWLVEQKDPASHLHKLKMLESLVLLDHEVTLAEMQYVTSLKQIKHLTIGIAPEGVEIGDQAFALLAKCVQLESLWICKKGLKESDLEILQKLPSLKHLSIEGEDLCLPYDSRTPAKHGLTENAAPLLATLQTLETLEVRGDAGFTDSSLEELTKLPKLKSLELDSSKFTDRALDIIASKMQLDRLNIVSPQFTDEGKAAFEKSAKIKESMVWRGIVQ